MFADDLLNLLFKLPWTFVTNFNRFASLISSRNIRSSSHSSSEDFIASTSPRPLSFRSTSAVFTGCSLFPISLYFSCNSDGSWVSLKSSEDIPRTVHPQSSSFPIISIVNN